MRALNNLPANYRLYRTLDLSRAPAVLGLNILAIPLLFIFGSIFSRIFILLNQVNPLHQGVFSFLTSFSGWEVLALLLSIIIMLVLHELIHGSFFWIYTRTQPRFALRSGYAFAAAPGWYLPKMQYIWVGLSPLVIISIISILIAVVASPALIPYLLLIATFNAAGSLGDMIVTLWVLLQPATVMIKDDGDHFEAFTFETDQK